MKYIRFTREGFENLKNDLERLNKERKEAVVLLQRYRDMGDLSENAAYRIAKSKLRSIDNNIRRTESLIRLAKVVEPANKDIIDIGSNVTVNDGRTDYVYTIVGGFESDLSKGRLSCNSPLGRALMGKRAGDSITISVPAGKLSYKILSII